MAVSGIQGINSEQFLQLFITQLRHQDPTSPLDPNTLTTQLAQLSTFESLQKLGTSFDQMLQLQQLTQGSDLLGRTIRFRSPSGTEQAAVVAGVSVQNGKVFLNAGTAMISLGDILGVSGTSSA